MKKSRIIRMLSEVIEDKQTGKQFWFDLDLYKHERDWPKPLSTKDICTKMELNTTYQTALIISILITVMRMTI